MIKSELRMRKGILTVAFSAAATLIWGQQDPQYSQFMFDRLSINPGVAGVGGSYCGTLLYRNQWMGFEGSPKTLLFNAEGPVKMLRGGVGLTFYNDKLGFETNNILRGHYSYHLPMNNGLGRLGAGISLGMAQKAFNAQWQPIDPNDPYIPPAQESQASFDLGLGVYYEQREFYAGLSTTHLLGQSLDNINMDVARHYWLMAGYNFYKLMNGQLHVTPALMVKTDIASTQVDINVTGKYLMGNNAAWLGLSYRPQDVIIVPMLGYMYGIPGGGTKADQYISIGLSYDMTASMIKQYSSGTVELFVRYCYKPVKIKPPIKINDVRFLGS
jgi:type IX secretion system PorP/SprF family membrane protein